ncbi:MAG: glycosyltransferase [Campylobacterota bacterium]|nr:glycosyltransferase [Campylobacterota bacterium]
MSTNNHPLVSFIIPFYNHNHFVKYTLDSILEDSYPNKEIIVINDGSSNPDDSSITQWISNHSSNISINYISRENVGLTKTLNELISLSNGKYIALCASDDYLINNTVSKRVEILENNPNKLLLLSDAIVVNDSNEKVMDSSLSELYSANKQNYLTDDGLKKEIITNWSVAGATHLINRELYDKVGLYNEKFIVEDLDFFLRVVAKDLILFYDEKVSAYRQHDTNLSGNLSQALRMHEDLHGCATTHSVLFDDEYKKMLLDKADYYKKQIEHYKRERSFMKQLKKRTKKFRHKIKSLFKRK